MNSESLQNVPVIYVTGFGPFGSHSENVSQKVVEKLASSNIELELKAKLHTEILDVAYGSVLKKVPLQWNGLQPKLVIHIGVSDLANTITLEKKAFNKDYITPDITHCLPGSVECLEGFPSCLHTQLDLERTVREVEKEGGDFCLKCVVSSDPGKYLCGFVYYLSLGISERRSLFIHVPTLRRVCEDPNMALTRLVFSVATVIKCLYRQVEEIGETETSKVEAVLRRVRQQPGPREAPVLTF